VVKELGTEALVVGPGHLAPILGKKINVVFREQASVPDEGTIQEKTGSRKRCGISGAFKGENSFPQRGFGGENIKRKG